MEIKFILVIIFFIVLVSFHPNGAYGKEKRKNDD